MKIGIVAGGTGGHFYPGLAVAQLLLSYGHQVFFVIKKDDYVKPLLERERIPYWAIRSAGLQRRLAPSNLLIPFSLLQGWWQSRAMLKAQRPDALLVMGGYLSVPPAIAARQMKIPVVLHEQNVIPGLANKMLSRLASRVAVSFAPGLAVFGAKGVLTGNPVRSHFRSLPSAIQARLQFNLDPHKRTLFVFGGSLGARRLNELITDALDRLPAYSDRVQILHITGKDDIERMRSRYANMKFGFFVESFCYDMAAAYAASDGIISRAGASTVAELLVVDKPALLIPYPLATDDHQTANANVLVARGNAELHQQRDLNVDKVTALLERFFEDKNAWKRLVDTPLSEVNPLESSGRIVNILSDVIQRPA